MEWAIDAISKKEVRASDKRVMPGRSYNCPTCGAPVRLRRGTVRAAHFMHARGMAKPDCENYWPSAWTKDADSVTLGARPFELYVRLVSEADSCWYWELQLGIPKPDFTFGQLRLPFGRSGERPVLVRAIPTQGLKIGVKPQENTYQIIPIDVPQGPWRDRVVAPIEGLNSECVNVFRYSVRGGRRLPTDSPLNWGRSYVFLWASESGPNWWPRSIVRRALRSYDTWSGAWVTFPDEPEEQVQRWAKAVLNREVMRSPAELILVSPQPLHVLPNGSFVIPAHEEVVVGVVGDLGATGWTRISASASDRSEVVSVQGTGDVPSLYVIEPLGLRRCDLWLDDEDDIGLSLIGQGTVAITEPQGIILRGVNRRGQPVRASLHSSDALSLLVQVQRREVTLKQVELPPRVKMTATWSDSCLNCSSRTFEGPDTRDTVLFESWADDLNRLVRSPSIELELNAGKFGWLRVGRRAVDESLIAMSDNWRNRAAWLLSTATMARKLGPHATLPISSFKGLQLERLAPADRQLVVRLRDELRVPRNLLSYLQSLIDDIDEVFQRTASVRGSQFDDDTGLPSGS